jgi:predicted NBD/HSP70 family sugar kinase
LANDLLDRSIITEAASVKLGGAKRKTTLLDINPDGGWVVALNVSGTRVRAAAMDLSGAIGEQVEKQLDHAYGEEFVTPAVLSALNGVIEKEKGRRGSPLAIGISTIGIVDDDAGAVKISFHLQLRDYPIARVVRQACDVPIIVRNDVVCSTLAELRRGHGRQSRDFAYVMADAGVGAGVVFDGEVRRFPSGAEFGLMLVAPAGDPERFGGRGYLESVSSGRGMAAAARKRLELGEKSLLSHIVPGGPGSVTMESVVEAARRGDEMCGGLLAEAASYLGIGIVNYAHTMGMGLFVIAGELSQAGGAFWEPLKKSVARHEYWSGMIRMEPSELGNQATIKGAGLLALDNVFSVLGNSNMDTPAPLSP